MSQKSTTVATFHGNEVHDLNDFKVKITRALIFTAGLALCFTGIGIIVGVPMMIFSFPKKSTLGLYTGNCPKCDQPIMATPAPIGFDCPICKTRIIRNGNTFSTV